MNRVMKAKERSTYLVKWFLISALIGISGGVIGSVFSKAIAFGTGLFKTWPFMLYLLPVSGLIITFLYQVSGEGANKGTNMVLAHLNVNDPISEKTGPLIFIGTVLTHAVGGSAGREGAALQVGGSLGHLIGRLLRLKEGDIKIAVMCGMATVFGALFGTPLAAAVFCIEVQHVGVLYHGAMMPCMFGAFLGAGIAQAFGLHAESFPITEVPAFGLEEGLLMILLGMCCSVVSVAFCHLLHETGHLYKKYLPNPYLRAAVGGLLVILLTLLSGSRAYNGSGVTLIEEALEGEIRYESFLVKAIFTAITLEAGFKGGEIVPTLCIGALFGTVFGSVLGFAPAVCGAAGMIACFASVTNCPISALLIAFEMCGLLPLPYFAIATSVCFLLSGETSLYTTQKHLQDELPTEVKRPH